MTARDYAAEIAGACSKQDVVTLTRVGFELLGIVQADEQRRAKQAEKTRNRRDGPEGTNGDNGGHDPSPIVPAGLRMSPDVPHGPGTENFASSELPRSTTTTHHTPPRARARAEVVADDLPPETRIALDGLRKDLGGKWPSVERFLQRRATSTHAGWIHEMLKLIGGGSQFTAEDLAQTCDDDAALERPIGSVHALRKFLQTARIERVNGDDHLESVDTKPRRRPATNGGARNDAAIDAAAARLEARHGQR